MTITIAFYRGSGTWRDKLIRFFDREWTWRTFWKMGTYSHCEYVENLQEDVDGNLWSHCIAASKRVDKNDGQQNDPRVRNKVIYFKKDHWDFLSFEGDETAALLYFYGTLGTPYDTLGAVSSITCLGWHDPTKLFCSEQMAQGVTFATPLDIKQPQRETPNSLFRLLVRSRLTPHHTEA